MLEEPSAEPSAPPAAGRLPVGSAPDPWLFWTFFVASLTILELILLIFPKTSPLHLLGEHWTQRGFRLGPKIVNGEHPSLLRKQIIFAFASSSPLREERSSPELKAAKCQDQEPCMAARFSPAKDVFAASA